MTPGKLRARRFALYLISIGISIVPPTGNSKRWAAALQTQYCKLGDDQRKLARRTGRRLIREYGSIKKSHRFIFNSSSTTDRSGERGPDGTSNPD